MQEIIDFGSLGNLEDFCKLSDLGDSGGMIVLRGFWDMDDSRSLKDFGYLRYRLNSTKYIILYYYLCLRELGVSND